jgi:selenocysteine lyase/cysteine desulfurase
MTRTLEGEALAGILRDSVIGTRQQVEGPFGPRRITYADYAASGRSVRIVEDFIRDRVLPFYGNTHSESSATARRTTRLREEARSIIGRCVRASEDDVVLFAGSGATGAIHKFVDILNLRLPADLDERYHLRDRIPRHERPVVFVGPYEHHSNELPWRESIADVVVVDEDASGRPDVAFLARALEAHRDRPLKIGSFSAASNVTGICTDTLGVTRLLHRHGALAAWDYAAAGPHSRIEMSPAGRGPEDHLDAVFLSPHKFVGGPGTPGVLVVKRRLLTNRVPTVPGGGTVAYVGPSEHRYLEDPVHREEGGTPDIVGAIRAGLAFHLKEAVGPDLIRRREDEFVARALERWTRSPNLRVLGDPKGERLAIVSFVVPHGDRLLHHNFLVALLNDLFGIQARGGCSCAGPYGHRLLGIDAARSKEFEKEILRGCEGIKPGWVRVGFNYLMTESTFAFLLDAVDFVAREAWRFLPLYLFSPETGKWEHREAPSDAGVSLSDFPEVPPTGGGPREAPGSGDEVLLSYLERAEELARELEHVLPGEPQGALEFSPAGKCYGAAFEELRWFPLPHEGLS